MNLMKRKEKIQFSMIPKEQKPNHTNNIRANKEQQDGLTTP